MIKKTFLAVIPARGGNEIIKFKNIQKVLKDKTLLDLSYIYAKKCNLLTELLLILSQKNKFL